MEVEMEYLGVEMGVDREMRGRDGGRLGKWGTEMRKKMGVDGVELRVQIGVHEGRCR